MAGFQRFGLPTYAFYNVEEMVVGRRDDGAGDRREVSLTLLMDFRSERRKTSGNLGRTWRRECLRLGPQRRVSNPRNEPSSFDSGLTRPDESRLHQSEHQGSKSKCQAPPRCLLVGAHRKTPAQTRTRLGPRAARQFLHRHDRTLRIVFLPPWHAFHGLAPGTERLYWCLPAFVLRSPDTRAAEGCLRGGFADFAETHFLALFAGQRTLQRPRPRMHADRCVVSFHRVLEPIAGFDLQRLANLPWNCCLSFPEPGNRGTDGKFPLLSLWIFDPNVGKLPEILVERGDGSVFGSGRSGA